MHLAGSLALMVAFHTEPCSFPSPWWPTRAADYNAPDINRDCTVDVSDQLELLGNWGPVQPGDCSDCDLNYDGDVGTPDLLILLRWWGATDED